MMLERFKVPAKDQVFVSEAALRRTVTEIFEKLGVSKEDSAEAADVLTMTDLRGVETHGVSNMLRAYVREYRGGKLDPRPGWTIERESPGSAEIDARRAGRRGPRRVEHAARLCARVPGRQARSAAGLDDRARIARHRGDRRGQAARHHRGAEGDAAGHGQ